MVGPPVGNVPNSFLTESLAAAPSSRYSVDSEAAVNRLRFPHFMELIKARCVMTLVLPPACASRKRTHPVVASCRRNRGAHADLKCFLRAGLGNICVALFAVVVNVVVAEVVSSSSSPPPPPPPSSSASLLVVVVAGRGWGCTAGTLRMARRSSTCCSSTAGSAPRAFAATPPSSSSRPGGTNPPAPRSQCRLVMCQAGRQTRRRHAVVFLVSHSHKATVKSSVSLIQLASLIEPV
jgi:hypothetical protein